MPAFFFKQPNGKFGRVSTVVDAITHYNLDKEAFKELVEYYHGKGDYEVAHFDEWCKGQYEYKQDQLKDVGDYLDLLNPNGDSLEDVLAILNKMGCSEEQIAKVEAKYKKWMQEVEEQEREWNAKHAKTDQQGI